MAKKAAPVQEVDEDEVELEELDTEVEEAPAKGKAKKAAADEPAFGIRQLCDYLESKTGKAYQPREVRTLLRKLARDGSGRVEREVTADNRNRYSWTGPTDPEVKAILAAVKGGEIEAGKKEALDKLKATKAAKDAAKAAAAPAAAKKTKKAAKPPVDDDEDEDIELEDDDD